MDSFKYLGIWLDPSLTWTTNFDKPVSKINKRIGLLRRIRNVLPQRTLNLLYKSLIVPHFDYCSVVWGNACETNLARLDKLQKAAGKMILGLPRRFPTDILLDKIGWQKLQDCRTTHLNVMVYKSLTCNLPSNLCNIFNRVQDTHYHVTRSNTHGYLVPPACKNNSASLEFTSRGVVSLNLLPSSIKNPLPPNVKSFKYFFLSQ